MFYLTRYFLLFFTTISIFFYPDTTTADYANSRVKVLFINSYHHGFEWSDTLVDSLSRHLQDSDFNVELSVEYMDTKRKKGKKSIAEFQGLLRAKYADELPSIILVSDDNAYQFILKRRETLFPEVPIVFLGVNNFKPSQLKGHEQYVTGLVQKTDIYDTAETALFQNPKADHILFIHDGSATGIGDEQVFRHELPRLKKQFPGLQVEYMTGKQHTTAEMIGKVKSLPKTYVAILSIWTSGLDEELIPYLESFHYISSNCSVPLYSPAGPGLTHGIVGGKLTTGEPHSKTAAEMVIKIISGTPVKDIPVVTDSVNHYHFDYQQLQRWNIDSNLLPSRYNLVNRPSTIFESYGHIVLPLLCFTILQSALIIILAINIRSRKQAETKLLELNRSLHASEERLELALAGANDGVWDWNMVDNTFNFDARYYTMAGYDPNDFPSTFEEWKKRVHPEDIATTQNKLQKYLADKGKGSFHTEFRFLRKDNSYIWIRGKGQTVRRDQSGRPLRFVGTNSDITDLQEAKKRLEESKEDFRLLYQQAPVMLHNIDMAGRLTEVNEQWLKTLGYEKDEVLGRRSIDFLTPESRQQAIELFPELYKKRILKGNEFQFVTKEGEVRNVLLTAHMVKNSTGDWSGTRAAIIDITERNKIKEEKDKLVKQLHQSQKMEAIGTLAGGIAHDFNNILSSIFGFTELAKMQAADGETIQKSLDQVLKSGERAKELVQHLLAFSRRAEVELQVLKVTPLLKETIKFIKATTPSTVEITYHVSNPESCLLADPIQMHQVFMNILTNAVHAMQHRGGSLDIKIDNITLHEGDAFQYKKLAPGKYVTITVSDTGCGIPKDKIDNIFDPFFTTKGKGEGTGLGLSVTYGIIQEMGGHISVYSEENRGTTFKIFLPEAPGSTDSPHKNHSAKLTRGMGKILLVDDEPLIIEWMADLLSQLGYQVIADSEPHSALQAFAKNPECFDLVVTDLTMPKMVGTELAKRIHAIRPNLPIILCTGFNDGLTEKTLKQSGVVKMLIKPVIASELSLVVKTCLNKERQKEAL